MDLFAGLGGFHLALSELGHVCVFASEIDEGLRGLYAQNFGIRPAGDIRDVALGDVPEHDILCAGFPCQPFSKAGSQAGFSDPLSGTLYMEIIRIIEARHPRYVILENVPHFERHDETKSWGTARQFLEDENYYVDIMKLSPDQFGIPQIRPRIYILASLEPLNGLDAIDTKGHPQPDIRKILEKTPADARPIPRHVARCLSVWQEFLDRVPRDERIPHPLWSMEFGATYPYEKTTPHATPLRELARFRGSHGVPLQDSASKSEALSLLPSHARTRQSRFPAWKIGFVRRNREFYQRHKDWIDKWLPKIQEFPSSFQKLEWNCQERDPSREVRDLSQYVIQIRASGVRVKRPTTAPSLIAMTSTQVPIIAWEGRYMTTKECQRLQSMEALEHMPESITKAYAALGNAVNVEVVRRLADAFIGAEPLGAARSGEAPAHPPAQAGRVPRKGEAALARA